MYIIGSHNGQTKSIVTVTSHNLHTTLADCVRANPTYTWDVYRDKIQSPDGRRTAQQWPIDLLGIIGAAKVYAIRSNPVQYRVHVYVGHTPVRFVGDRNETVSFIAVFAGKSNCGNYLDQLTDGLCAGDLFSL